VGNHRELDLPLLDIECGIRRIPLRIYYLLLANRQSDFASADCGKEGLGIERLKAFSWHKRELQRRVYRHARTRYKLFRVSTKTPETFSEFAAVGSSLHVVAKIRRLE
jgi:hypothetical protein